MPPPAPPFPLSSSEWDFARELVPEHSLLEAVEDHEVSLHDDQPEFF